MALKPASRHPVHRVAVVQAAPVLFDVEGSLAKVADLAGDAARRGAKLAVFPEAMVGSYPKGAVFGSYMGGRTPEGRDLFHAYWESASELPGPTSDRLGEIARANAINLVVGVIERDGGTLYCSVVTVSEAGALLGHRRKLMPTGIERLVWGQGDASRLDVHATTVGRLGAVVCWENYMPLLRMAMYQQGIQIYCAPTLDERDTWAASMRHIAAEGRCFVLSACQVTTQSDFPDLPSHFAGDPDGFVSRGGSCIVDPFGRYLMEPVFDREHVLVADADLAEVVRGKFDFDVVGHYARPDLFRLSVNRASRSASVVFEEWAPMRPPATTAPDADDA